MTLLIQEAESPERNLPHGGRLDVVGCHEGVVLSFQLAEAFVGTTNLYHRIAVDAEVALLIASITSVY